MPDVLASELGPSILGMTHDDDFEFRITEVPKGSVSGTETIIFPDTTITASVITGATNEFVVGTTPVSLGGPQQSLRSLTPFQCEVDANGLVTKGSGGDGLCVIEASGPYGSRTYSRIIETTGNAKTFEIQGYTPGSLAHHVYSLIASYFADREAKLMQLHLHELNRRQWRVNRIAPGLDMSWQSVDASDGPAFPCSLISPRHATCAAHAGFGVGRRYLFLQPNGTTVEATAKRIWKLFGSDLGLVYFDTEVTGCAIAKMAPNLAEKTTLDRVVNGDQSSYLGYTFPALVTLFNYYFMPDEVYGGRKLMTTGLSGINAWGDPNKADLRGFHPIYRVPVIPNSYVRVGDSGSAVFFPVVEPGNIAPTSVLVSALHGVPVGPPYSKEVEAINSAMNAIKDPDDTNLYAVQQADLSAFPTYP